MISLTPCCEFKCGNFQAGKTISINRSQKYVLFSLLDTFRGPKLALTHSLSFSFSLSKKKKKAKMEPGLANTQRALIGPESLPRGSSLQGYTATAVASRPFHVEGLEVERLGMREGGVLVQGVRGTALEGGYGEPSKRKRVLSRS